MPDTSLSRVTAAVAGRYEVDREIGHGGMATVYLARDTKHNRKVALKVLNEELGAVLGVKRFLSEVQVTANLQHPNLLPLYDSGESDGVLYYVMPYVEGESLRDRLNRERQLPADEAIRIAAAIAGALDHAHKAGVIHRDLKPENILLQGGQPFVADFGIALAVTNAGGARFTQTGLAIGSPQYMSPEQATGERGIDARTDVYSLGAVLYEMLAGEPPHMGGTAQAVIARMMTEKPRPVRELRDTLPERVDMILVKALAKVPADRFTTAGDMRDALLELSTLDGWKERPARATRSRLSVVPWAIAVVAVALALWTVATAPDSAPPVTMEVVLAGASLMDGFAVSPDGRSVAYVGGTGASRQIYVRALDQLDARALPGTTGGDHPVWSPDGASIAFTGGGQVKRTPSAGGPVQAIGPYGYGYDWADNTTLIIGTGLFGTGLRKTTGAGSAAVITKPAIDSGEMFHASPLRLGGGKVAFVVWGAGGLEDDFLAVGDLGSGSYVQSRLPAVAPVAFVDGWLLYQDVDRRLMATRPDLGTMRLDPVPVVVYENVVAASITAGASLVLRGERTTAIERRPLAPGAPAETILESNGIITGTQLSPDGKRIVYVNTQGDSAQLLVHDLRAKSSVRIWTGGGVKDPVWTPDGKLIVFSEGAPRLGLWSIAVSGGEAPRLITANGYPGHAAVAPDNRTVVYTINLPLGPSGRRYDLWVTSVDGTVKPYSLAAERNGTSLPDVSPNGRWLAYDGNETTRDEVYVRPMNGAGQVRVSLEGGMEPRWSRDGRTLYYRIAGDVYAATIRETAGAIEVLKREKVAHFASSSASEWDTMYDVGEGNELLVSSANEKNWRLLFMQRWSDELQRILVSARQR